MISPPLLSSLLSSMLLVPQNFMKYETTISKHLNRKTAIAAIVAFSLFSILYLVVFFPAFSVKNSLESLLPASSFEPNEQTQWSANPRRLIVFGDSWSDNGQYPIDPPPKDQMPKRKKAQGKVWTEWLCSAVSQSNRVRTSRADSSRCRAFIMTISQGRCLSRGIVVTLGLSSIAA